MDLLSFLFLLVCCVVVSQLVEITLSGSHISFQPPLGIEAHYSAAYSHFPAFLTKFQPWSLFDLLSAGIDRDGRSILSVDFFRWSGRFTCSDLALLQSRLHTLLLEVCCVPLPQLTLCVVQPLLHTKPAVISC